MTHVRLNVSSGFYICWKPERMLAHNKRFTTHKQATKYIMRSLRPECFHVVEVKKGEKP